MNGETRIMEYCKSCAESRLKKWRGWPLKNIVPILPKFNGESACFICGSMEKLNNKKIWWESVNSIYSTGLPDYWILHTSQTGKFWGYPYLKESNCPNCSRKGVVSQINFPDFTIGYVFNCLCCRLVDLPKEFLNKETNFD